MEKSNFSLRILPSLLKGLQRIAEQEDCSVNQLINVAIAEKLAVLDAPRFEVIKRSAAGRQSAGKALDLLKRKSGSEIPHDGDKLPSRGKQLRVRTSVT